MSAPVLVTGGAGFIGSHACKALAHAGRLPVCLDNLSRGHADAVRWGPLVVADVRDRAAVRRTLEEHRITAIMHFAALAEVGESVADPLGYHANNVGGMIALLEAAVDAGVRTVILSSSCAVYGRPPAVPVTEEMPLAPVSPYGESKRICEAILADTARATGMRWMALRYFNAAGADPEGELAERHDPETHLIPLVLRAAQGRTPALRIFGADYPTPDGTCVRDYIHVTDLVEAHLAALEVLEGGGESDALNLGTGQGHSVLEVIRTAERVLGRPVPHEIAPRRPGDADALFAATERMQERLGFTPRRSALATIISDAARSQGLEPAPEDDFPR